MFKIFTGFHIFSWILMDCWLAGGSSGWLAGWVAELLGLLSLLGLLEGVFGFVVLLEGGLNLGVSHARRSERSAISFS